MTGGPFFEELAIGQVFTAPAYTLTEGRAAVHQSIVGDRAAVNLDAALGRAVLRSDGPPAAVGFVLDVAIGGSTLVTRRVRANLFYRGLQLLRMPALGDTLHTRTEVVALRQSKLKPGRPSSGLVALRIRTLDQQGRAVLDFARCALLPLRDSHGLTTHADDLDAIELEVDEDALIAQVTQWDLGALRKVVPGPYASELLNGERWRVDDADVVSSAPELARLTANVAAVHHDRRAGADGRRLVYGGHTIGLAANQIQRALPAVAAIPAWHSCDHLAPVLEDDALTSEIELERLTPLPGGGALVALRSQVHAHRAGEEPSHVLDWRCLAVIA